MALELARELGLADPGAPWHAQRDRLAALMAACGVYTGALGKIARDVSLLMQDEVAEAAEPPTGGGSSTMPHKRNPAGCAMALAAATRVPGLVAAFLSGMVQEHERGVGGWHAEAPTVAAVVQTHRIGDAPRWPKRSSTSRSIAIGCARTSTPRRASSSPSAR